MLYQLQAQKCRNQWVKDGYLFLSKLLDNPFFDYAYHRNNRHKGHETFAAQRIRLSFENASNDVLFSALSSLARLSDLNKHETLIMKDICRELDRREL